MSSNVRCKCKCSEQFYQQLCHLQRGEVAICPDDFSVLAGEDGWAKLFLQQLAEGCELCQDDIIWVVRPGCPPRLDVFRKNSNQLPLPGSSNVLWQSTTELNMILHQVEYVVTCAVCTKTSPSNLQILRRVSQRVFPSPSRRRMDSKGEREEISYPHIFFSVDQFEQVFDELIARDGECVCVELVGRIGEHAHTALFVGSIRYEVLHQVYQSRSNQQQSWSRWLLSQRAQKHMEYIRMRGPHGKGHAEMAICRCEAVDDNGDVIGADDQPSAADWLHSQELDAAEQYRRRRQSETHLADAAQPARLKKYRSEADYSNQYPEVECSSISDELEESVFSRLWSMRGFGQAWHWLRERRRHTCVPLTALLTYVTLPVHLISEAILDQQQHRAPLLTFDKES